jgi:hypothetical protein
MVQSSRHLLLCLAGLAACSNADAIARPEPYCTASVEPGLIVYIVDAVDGTPQATDAVGFALDGGYSDALKPSILHGTTLVALQAASERPGVYQVHIEKPGYQTWTRSNVRVMADACHVRTVQVTAALQPVRF